MEAVSGEVRAIERPAARTGAFRAADQYALEVWQVARSFPRSDEGERLGRELRRTASRAAGALVGSAATSPSDVRGRIAIEGAREALLESRYYLYLARRLGVLDLKKYRHLAARHDSALRSVDAILPPG